MSAPELKTCTRCKETKPVSAFPTRKRRSGNGVTPRSVCKQCELDYQRARRGNTPKSSKPATASEPKPAKEPKQEKPIKLPPPDLLHECANPECGVLHLYGLFCSTLCRREARAATAEARAAGAR